MAIWEDVGSTYVEAATSALPLHRLFVFVAGFSGALAIQSQTHLSIIESIIHVPLTEIANVSSGPLSKATVAELFAGIAAVVVGWMLHRLTIRCTFSLAANATNLWDRVSGSISVNKPDPKLPLDDRKTTMELIDISLEEPRGQLRKLSATAELLIGLAIPLVVVSYWGNILDFIIGVSFSLAAIGCQITSVRVFLRDYFGPALYKAQLIGKRAPGAANIS